ncbi:MAG: flagellin, partial [Gammaproteobacteria bacterium]
TNSTSDREALDAEVQQLKDEIDRVATQTSFNGKKLLDGSFSSQVFQVGANGGESIAISEIADTRTESLGVSDRAVGTSAAVTNGDLGAIAGDQLQLTVDDGAGGTKTVNLGAVAEAESIGERLSQLANAVNKVSGESGVTAYINADDNTLSLVSDKDFSMQGSVLGGSATDVTAAATNGLADIKVTDAFSSSMALDTIDTALQKINGTRADLGALQSRFENAVTNIQITSENLSAARGRIVDADFAQETAAMTRAQILSQAGTAMVSQANSTPRSVLSLLG